MRQHIFRMGIGLALLLALAGCKSAPVTPPQPIAPGTYTADIQTDMGTISVQLFSQQAPIAVGNFVGLARGTMNWRDADNKVHTKTPFYDGLTFHRVIAGFMIQGGDPLGDGTGDPGYSFKNEIAPDLHFDQPGRLGMANGGEDGTNGSQFFITVAPQPQLDGKYTVFGQVTSGMDVVTAISNVQRDKNDKPIKPVHIVKVTIHQS